MSDVNELQIIVAIKNPVSTEASNWQMSVRISTVSSAIVTRFICGFPQSFKVNARIFLDEAMTASLLILFKSIFMKLSTTGRYIVRVTECPTAINENLLLSRSS